MNNNTGTKIYKVIMLIVITALITGITTTLFVYKNLSGTMDIKNIVESGDNTGLELTLSKIRSMIEKEYIGELDDKAMIESAIKGYVEGVGDKYTEYYTPEEMSELLDETSGNYVGIGIYMLVNKESGQILVVNPMEGSPAESVGIKSGDIITKVNDEEVTAENASDMSNKIKGKEGTKVRIQVLREGKTVDFEIERKRISISHINTKVLEDNIGYIEIKDFDGGTAKEFKTKYQELEKKGIKSLIIDIRSNGGGVVDESIEILDMLCKKDSVLLITVNRNKEEEITKAESDPIINIPVVVLTNEYSASASEILAGALKDNKVAELVGTRTYGKGVIQTLHKLTDGSGLKITSEEYYTPNHSKINKVGIEPNYEVKLPEGVEKITEENDTQLKKAIELLK